MGMLYICIVLCECIHVQCAYPSIYYSVCIYLQSMVYNIYVYLYIVYVCTHVSIMCMCTYLVLSGGGIGFHRYSLIAHHLFSRYSCLLRGIFL